MNIGILFGSFDPIHIGHIALATHALNTSIVDKVILVPAYHNPWKDKEPESFKHRFNMCCTAINNLENVDISVIEEKIAIEEGKDKVNTYHTLDYLKKYYPKDNIIIIMSNETFNELKQWYKGEDILHENKFLIIPREGVFTDWRMLAGSKDYWVSRDFPRMDISSTLIREYIQEDKETTPWVPKEVSNYIKLTKLYK